MSKEEQKKFDKEYERLVKLRNPVGGREKGKLRADAYFTATGRKVIEPKMYDENHRLPDQQVPFAGQLASAMKSIGYSMIVVTGYHGPVSSSFDLDYKAVDANGYLMQRAKDHRTRWNGDGKYVTWNGVRWY